ncbi:MAG TPA: hypothetical protein VKT27_10970 [Candidatus Binataceae bacterium]|nr:hypothetical protein [Candidatus Binataceae bacterium]
MNPVAQSRAAASSGRGRLTVERAAVRRHRLDRATAVGYIKASLFRLSLRMESRSLSGAARRALIFDQIKVPRCRRDRLERTERRSRA